MTKHRRMFLWSAIVYLALTMFFFMEALFTPSLNYDFPFVGYGGTFLYSSFNLGRVSVSLYWLMHGVGIVGMIWMCLSRAKTFQVPRMVAVLTALLLAVFGFFGAKLLYILENWESVRQKGLSLGGVSFFGTVFFMPLIIPLMALVFRKKPLEYLDYCTPAGIIMLACIRTGCFLNGCCHGITMWFDSHPVVLPSQLIECTLDMLLLHFIFRMEQSGKTKGHLYALFMGGYGTIRFLVELTRATPKTILGLSHGQCFSLVCIFVFLLILLYNKQTTHKNTLN